MTTLAFVAGMIPLVTAKGISTASTAPRPALSSEASRSRSSSPSWRCRWCIRFSTTSRNSSGASAHPTRASRPRRSRTRSLPIARWRVEDENPGRNAAGRRPHGHRERAACDAPSPPRGRGRAQRQSPSLSGAGGQGRVGRPVASGGAAAIAHRSGCVDPQPIRGEAPDGADHHAHNPAAQISSTRPSASTSRWSTPLVGCGCRRRASARRRPANASPRPAIWCVARSWRAGIPMRRPRRWGPRPRNHARSPMSRRS